MTTEFYEKLGEYYELKQKYESDYEKLKSDIVKSNSGIKEKQEAFAKLKPKCINCYRPVGTLFDILISEDTLERKLIAKCGDKEDPCMLNIELAMGLTKLLPEFIDEEEKTIKTIRNEIIGLKNKLFVGEITNEQVIEKFDELKNEINTSNQLLEYYFDIYLKLVANPELEKKIRRTEADKFVLKNEMNNALKEYRKTGNNKLIQDAVEIYVNQFMPLVKMCLQEKYDECKVITKETRKNEITYILMEKKNTIEKLEHSIIEPKIIHFQTGYSATGATKQKGPKRGAKTEKVKRNLLDDLSNIQKKQ